MSVNQELRHLYISSRVEVILSVVRGQVANKS